MNPMNGRIFPRKGLLDPRQQLDANAPENVLQPTYRRAPSRAS
jgi:hypothetical protein